DVVRLRDLDAVPRVAQRRVAGGVDADVVVLHHVERRAGMDDQDSVAAVGGDDVAGGGGDAADRVAGRAVHADADRRVADRVRAARVRADVVAGDGVARGGRRVQENPAHAVAADDVSIRGG